MPTPHDHIAWVAPVSAPDVRMFHAGTFDRATNTWTDAMRWDTLAEKLMVDWACVLPVIMANWSAVAIWLRTPNGLGGYIEQAATGKFTGDDFETDPVSGLKYRYDAISIEPQFVPNPPEAWDFIAVSYDRNGNANMTGGVVTGPTATLTTLPATSGIDFTPPANVTDVVAADPEWTDPGPDGVRLIRQKITYSIADAITLGVHVFAEAPDQSAADPIIIGESTVGGSTRVAGEWAPIDVGRFAYEAGKPLVMELPQPPVASESRRFYLVSYRDRIENTLVRHGEASATPSVVVTHTQYSGATGEEFSRNVTGMVLIETGTANSDGKLKRYIEVGAVAPDDANFAGVTADLVDSTGKLIAANDFGGTEFTAAGGIRVLWDEPASVTTWSLRLRSFSGTGTNNYAVGVTPEISVSVGTTTGTVDFGAAIRDTLGAYFDVDADGNFVIKNKGLSRTELADQIIGIGQLEDAQIIKNAQIVRAGINRLLVLDADIDTLAANKVTAGVLVAGVTYTGTLNANQVNAGAFVGCSLTLTSGGITSEISNLFDAILGKYVGVRVKDSTTWERFCVSKNDLAFMDSSNKVLLRCVMGSGAELYLSPITGVNGGSFQLFCDGTAYCMLLVGGSGSPYLNLTGGSPELKINGTRVVRARTTLASNDVAGIITVLQYHGLC